MMFLPGTRSIDGNPDSRYERGHVFGRVDVPGLSSSPPFPRPRSTRSDPVLVSSYFQASPSDILFVTRLSRDYLLLTPGRKSAWGVLSLGRTDVGE